MSDIVERLLYPRPRAIYDTAYNLDTQTMREAADEIEKLRAQVVSLQSSLDAGPPKPGKKTPDALGRKP